MEPPGLDILEGKTASREALGRWSRTVGILPLTLLGMGKACSRPILISRLHCQALPAAQGARQQSRSRARPTLAPLSARIARGRGPVGAGFLSGRRQCHSGGGCGGGLWGPLSARHRPSPLRWQQGECGTVGWWERQKVQVRRLRGAALLPRVADIFPLLCSQPRTVAAVPRLRETRRFCWTASRRNVGPGLLKEGRV